MLLGISSEFFQNRILFAVRLLFSKALPKVWLKYDEPLKRSVHKMIVNARSLGSRLNKKAKVEKKYIYTKGKNGFNDSSFRLR